MKKIIFLLLISTSLFAQKNAGKDSSEVYSGLIFMSGAYAAIGDGASGYELGGEVFYTSRKFQAGIQGLLKLRNDKPDFQFCALGGRKVNFHKNCFAIFSGGFGCEFEKIEKTTLLYNPYPFVSGTETSTRSSQYWGGKMQFEIFEGTRNGAFGAFMNFFLAEDYQDFEIGLSWMPGM